jgi:hypothetical protein
MRPSPDAPIGAKSSPKAAHTPISDESYKSAEDEDEAWYGGQKADAEQSPALLPASAPDLREA